MIHGVDMPQLLFIFVGIEGDNWIDDIKSTFAFLFFKIHFFVLFNIPQIFENIES